jgi:hypothetical protein
MQTYLNMSTPYLPDAKLCNCFNMNNALSKFPHSIATNNALFKSCTSSASFIANTSLALDNDGDECFAYKLEALLILTKSSGFGDVGSIDVFIYNIYKYIISKHTP